MSVRTDDTARAARAKQWVESGKTPLAIKVRLLGSDVPMWVNSLLCAYPDMSVAMVQCRESPHTMTTFKQAYPHFKDLAVPPPALRAQQTLFNNLDEVARQRFIAPTSGQHWQLAMDAAKAFDVPVACIIFATTANGDAPVVLLQAIATAPLKTALRHLQETTRLLC